MTASIIIAIIIGLVEVTKRWLKLPGRYLPLTAVLLGIVIMLISGTGYYGHTVLVGIMYGLSAVGLFSGVKNTIGK